MVERIIDKDLEEHLRGMIDKQVRDSKATLINAGNMMQEKQRGLEESVAQKPYHYIAGALMAGIIIGALSTKRRCDK
ncbi:MAG: hypothetical protein WAX07_03070 [Candidatus Altiarchaeia archaeon]|jgi:ElaB/YqjD/DUF883 family membrane-anchored ribosome-binding protein